MLRMLLICAAVLLCVGCDKSDESLYDLAGDWERITDAECVGDLEDDFLARNRFTIFSDPSGLTIEQDGEALVLDFHGGPRADAIPRWQQHPVYGSVAGRLDRGVRWLSALRIVDHLQLYRSGPRPHD